MYLTVGEIGVLELELRDFDLKQIADSGQCFRLNRAADGSYNADAGERRLNIRGLGGGRFALDCGREEFETFWRAYFDLDADYGAWRRAVDAEDDYLTQAAEYGSGIRILRQDPWEMLCTFILSQRKKIPAIKSAVETLCRKYGKPFETDGGIRFAFPAPERLAGCTVEELGTCALGYRAKYVHAAARMTASGELDLAGLGKAEDEVLLEALKGVYGVGDKVASCVMLFGFHRMDAFPKDVWIYKALDARYRDGFPYDRYRGFNGVIQQYIFYYQRFLDGQG
ncbi:MAG: DNA-3-methyladenine glycosylase 2 family protein [Clostridia bacterium]|nr:DNA-3-methyladenine glycosylase 2 family protein [Clostridia bacterium]